LFVNNSTRNMFNWVLVTMMVMLPLRAVLAIDQSSCQMHDETDQHSSAQQSTVHHKHLGHMMFDADQNDVADSHNCCCCDNSASCNYDCGIGMNASIIMQQGMTVPVLNKASLRTHVENNLVFRELIPLTRPPAYL